MQSSRANWTTICLSLALASLAGCSLSEEPPAKISDTCGKLDLVIDRDIAEIAVAAFENQGGIQARQNNIRLNAELMAQNKCPPRNQPIEPLAYSQEHVLQCVLARLEMQKSPGARKPDAKQREREKCNPRNWSTAS